MADRILIPNPVMATCADLLGVRLGRTQIESLLMRAGAPGHAPLSNCIDKVRIWLQRANETDHIDPMAVLGRTIQSVIDEALDADHRWHRERIQQRDDLTAVLAEHGLRYVGGARSPLAPAHLRAASLNSSSRGIIRQLRRCFFAR